MGAEYYRGVCKIHKQARINGNNKRCAMFLKFSWGPREAELALHNWLVRGHELSMAMDQHLEEAKAARSAIEAHWARERASSSASA